MTGSLPWLPPRGSRELNRYAMSAFGIFSEVVAVILSCPLFVEGRTSDPLA